MRESIIYLLIATLCLAGMTFAFNYVMNRETRLAYESGLRVGFAAGQKEEIKLVPAYAVYLPSGETSNTTFIFDRKGEAIPVIYLSGDKDVEINNCTFFVKDLMKLD